MFSASIRAIGHTIRAASGGASAHEIALGTALGVLLGLVPKTNLTAVLLCGIILSLRLNLPAAAIALIVTTPLTAVLDRAAAGLGSLLLSISPLEGAWSWFLQQPLVPWLQLNDTLVLGQLTIGVLLLWPIYAMARGAVLQVSARLNRASFTALSRSTLPCEVERSAA